MSNLFTNPSNGIGTSKDPAFRSFLRDKNPIGLDWPTIRAIYKNNEICQNCVNFKAQMPVKNWRSWESEKEEALDKIKSLEDLEENLNLKRIVREALLQMNLYGGCLVLLHTGQEDWSIPLTKDEEVRELSILPIFRLTTGVELDNDPMSENYLKPRFFKVARGQKIHASRTLIFRRNLTIDYYSSQTMSVREFFGYSIFEAIESQIKIYEANNNTLLNMAQDSQRIVVQSPELMRLMMLNGDPEAVEKQYEIANFMASNISVWVVGNGDTVSVLEKDYQQSIDAQKDVTLRITGYFNVPEVIALGKSLTGLGSDPEGYLAIYDEAIVDFQKTDLSFFLAPLDSILKIQAGFEKHEVNYVWNPLRNISEKEKEEILILKLDKILKLQEIANLSQDEILKEIEANEITITKIKEDSLDFSESIKSLIDLKTSKNEIPKVEEDNLKDKPEEKIGILKKFSSFISSFFRGKNDN